MRLLDQPSISWTRLALLAAAAFGLMVVFLFQDIDILQFITDAQSPNLHFAVNRGVRLLMNDICMLIFIAAWFQDRAVTRLAVFIQLVDFLILLPLYLLIKLTWEGDSEISSPLLSQFHRLIVNPTLMILLIPAVYFQRLMKKDE